MDDDEPISRYLSMLRSERGFPVNTLTAYRSDLVKLLTFLRKEGRKAPAALSRRDVPALLSFLQHQALSSASVARCLAAWRGFYRFLLSEGDIQENPFLNLTSPKATLRLPKTLHLEQVERLLEAPGKAFRSGRRQPDALRDDAMLEVLYATGLRATELLT
ncbi:MAG: hypothetical protein E6K67_02525, partial [Nitrospirae bacterium]